MGTGTPQTGKSNLTDILSDFRFWFSYFSLFYPDYDDLPDSMSEMPDETLRNDPLGDIEGAAVILHCTPNHKLEISFSPGAINLDLRDRSEPMNLGWVDGHFCPEALRFGELLLVLERLKTTEGFSQSARFAAGLLLQFTSFSARDELVHGQELLREMLVRESIVPDTLAREFASLVFSTEDGDSEVFAAWQNISGFWTPTGEIYSLRCDPEFDHQRLAAFFDALHASDNQP